MIKKILIKKEAYEEACGVLWRVISLQDSNYIICWLNPATMEVEVKLVDLFMSEISNYSELPASVLGELASYKAVVEEWIKDSSMPYPIRDEEAEEAFTKIVNGTEEEENKHTPVTPLSLNPDDYIS